MGLSLYDIILDANTSNIAISDGTNTLAVNGDGSIDVAFAPGASIEITDGADTLAINADGSINVNLTDDGIADDAADAGNPLKVGGRANGSLLGAVSADNDRVDMLFDLYRRQYVAKQYNVGHSVQNITVGAAAVQLDATALAGRTNVTLQNVSNNSIWLGTANTVTADNTSTGGIVIPKNSSYTDDFGENLQLWAISDGAGRVMKVHQKG